MKMAFKAGFKNRVQVRYDRFDMRVGILQNGEHRDAAPEGEGPKGFKGEGPRTKTSNLSEYAGGPIRKMLSSGSKTLEEVSAANRERLGFNYLAEPFKHRSSDIIKFSEYFFKMASGKAGSMAKRVENLLQAIVRNPILRGEYGKQRPSTTREKGFYRPMMDTAQLFKGITASVKIRGRK